MRNFGRLD